MKTKLAVAQAHFSYFQKVNLPKDEECTIEDIAKIILHPLRIIYRIIYQNSEQWKHCQSRQLPKVITSKDV